MNRRAAMRRVLWFGLLAGLIFAIHSSPEPAGAQALPRVAVLAVRDMPEMRGHIVETLRRTRSFAVLDSALVDAAVTGAGYDGSLNLSTQEARRIGSVAGADAFVLAVASAVDRSTDGGSYGDAFIGLFLVDSRSGRLLRYRGIGHRAMTRDTAWTAALAEANGEMCGWAEVLQTARAAAETAQQDLAGGEVDFVSDPDASGDLIPPRFFTKPAPVYTADASRAGAAATVEVVVHFRADGTYGPIEIVRWAGFGLDEAVTDAIRARQFYPARKTGNFVNARAFLRYNFRIRK